MHIYEGKDKLALFSTKYNVLLTPLPFIWRRRRENNKNEEEEEEEEEGKQ